MLSHVRTVAIAGVLCMTFTGWFHSPSFAQERREEGAFERERREDVRERRERCERLDRDLAREERAERGERAEGDRREVREIRERIAQLRDEYRDRRCGERREEERERR
jgi:hypothetical protein